MMHAGKGGKEWLYIHRFLHYYFYNNGTHSQDRHEFSVPIIRPRKPPFHSLYSNQLWQIYGRLKGGISHRLNGPLAALLGQHVVEYHKFHSHLITLASSRSTTDCDHHLHIFFFFFLVSYQAKRLIVIGLAVIITTNPLNLFYSFFFF